MGFALLCVFVLGLCAGMFLTTAIVIYFLSRSPVEKVRTAHPTP